MLFLQGGLTLASERKLKVLTIQDQANLIPELNMIGSWVQCEGSSISTLCPDQMDPSGCQNYAWEFTRGFPFQLSLYSNFCPLHSSGLSKERLQTTSRPPNWELANTSRSKASPDAGFMPQSFLLLLDFGHAILHMVFSSQMPSSKCILNSVQFFKWFSAIWLISIAQSAIAGKLKFF